MEIAREIIMMDMEKYQMSALREKSETDCRIWEKKSLYSQMIAVMINAIVCEAVRIVVRSFGQVFAFKGDTVSVGVRGPVSIHQAVSLSPVDVVSMQITKSVNSERKEGKSSDTMGMKHRIEFGLYEIKGSINCQLAEKTGFSDEDAEKIKHALCTLFENDSSSARPEGSMEVCRLYWWKHNCKTPSVSTAKVHRSLKILEKDPGRKPQSFEDYLITVNELPGGIVPEIIDLM